MEQRLKTLEDLCSIITKEIVEQNKNMMDINKNLLNEIRCLRESFVKQDDYFEEFKTLLRKLYELNKQSAALTNFPASMMTALPPVGAGPMGSGGGMLPSFIQQMMQSQQPTPTNATISSASVMNNSYLNDFTNQSMINNVSYQSERTPFNTSSLPPTFGSNNNNLNLTASSIPSSASALQKQQNQQQQQQQQQQQNLLKQSIVNQQQQVQKPLFPPNLSQPPPPTSSVSLQNINNNKNGLPQPQIPISVSESNIKFMPTNNTTSTPQAAASSSNSQFNLFKPQQSVNQTTNNNNNKPPPFQLSPSKPSNQDQQKPPSIFGSNLFKTNSTESAPLVKTTQSIFGAPPANLFKAPEPSKLEDHEDLAGGEGNPEEYEPQCDFKPIVQLKEVEVKTGEEDEEVLYAQRCKLYRYVTETKEWKEKGVGELKLLKHKQTNVLRLLMRRDQVLKLCANHRISPDLKLNQLSDKQLSWMACDFSEPSDPNGKNEIFLVKFKLAEEASKFKQEFEKAVQTSKSVPSSSSAQNKQVTQKTTTSNQPSLSEQFKTENWKCNACYAPNKKDDIKCACCQTPRPGNESSSASTQSGILKFPSSNTSPAINLLSKSTNEPPKSQSTFSLGLQNSTNNITSSKLLFSFGSQQQPSATNTPPKFEFSPFNPNQQQQQQQQPTSNTVPLFGSNNTNTGSLLGSKPLFGSATTGDVSSIFKSTPTAPGGFSGGIQPSTLPAKPLFGAIPSTGQTGEEEGGEDGGDNQNPEEYEPQVDFKPIVKLQEVDVKTGEEDEDVVFKQRCKLYRFISGEWKEKGTGEMKILRNKQHNYMFRILMRRDQVLKLCANHRITPELKFEIFNEKQVRWHAQDYSEGDGKHETLAVRFKSEEDAKKFKSECENAQKLFATSDQTTQLKPQSTAVEDKSKPSLSQIFKKENTWTCTGCYVNNKQEAEKCVACGTLAPNSISNNQTNQTSQTKPVNENKIPFGLSAASATKAEPISFASSTFGKPTDQSNKTTIDSVFGAKSGPSFADLAKQSQPMGFGGGFKSFGAQPLFGASSQPKPLFGSATNNEEEGGEDGENQNPEEYEPQVEFKPLVKLSEVEVKTGEEDEDVLFKQRCKIYRFVTEAKEWKEKGTGEIKILKHKQKEHSYRIVMRRDQVLKICANHRVTPDMKLEIINDKQVRYLCNDCSEGDPSPEYLTIRFRNEEDAKNYKSQVESIQQELSKASPTKNVSTNNSNKNVNNNVKSNGLASLVKQGTWACDSCLSSNKPEAEKCASCEAPKPNATYNKKNDDDVQITGTVTASNKQIEEARKFGLPDNFYLYEKKAPCPGCRGCENES